MQTGIVAVKVDYGRLILEWFILIIITLAALAIILFGQIGVRRISISTVSWLTDPGLVGVFQNISAGRHAFAPRVLATTTVEQLAIKPPDGAVSTGKGTLDGKRHWLDKDGKDLGVVPPDGAVFAAILDRDNKRHYLDKDSNDLGLVPSESAPPGGGFDWDSATPKPSVKETLPDVTAMHLYLFACFLFGAAALVLAGLYPPWLGKPLSDAASVESYHLPLVPAGYGWLWQSYRVRGRQTKK
ncbi:MAG TPA: hypothetical protein VGV68_05160 [Terriglobia bacterium]|nr:hypothetical protein [Terriglobia bacterium]